MHNKRSSISRIGRYITNCCFQSSLFIASLVVLTHIAGAPAAVGTLEQTFNFSVGDMAANPDYPFVYATIPATDSLAVINTNTLALAATISLGVAPNDITVSPDGSKVYIANDGPSILVLNTSNNTLANAVPLGQASSSVAVGSDNRLWVESDGIEQIDATTGASTGPNANVPDIYSGRVLTSPDGNDLYYATYTLTPGALYKFNVSGFGAPQLLYENPTDIGENGEDLVLSEDGSKLAYVCGYGNGGYQIPVFRTSDMTIISNCATGAYPEALAFSPDASVAYATHSPYPTAVGIFDANTGAQLGQFAAADESRLAVVDNTGNDLFVDYDGISFDGGDDTLKVYSVPEPVSSSILLAAPIVLGLRRRA